jgi:septum formation protein
MKNSSHPSLILASTSPRRRELLGSLGLAFEVRSPEAEEIELPKRVSARALPALVAEVALAKARDVASRSGSGAVVIGSDTTVHCLGRILGKPTDVEDAFRILRTLSGREHRVFTAIALCGAFGEVSAVECSRVRFRELSDREIRCYIETGEPMDKAGAYGIQGCGGLFIEAIVGRFDNVMGMSLLCLTRLLDQVGVDFWDVRPGS